ncbi:MAG: ribonuclease P protein component [Quisquiliibacterium sp.]
MARRQLADPVFSVLSRRRPELSSEHFAVCVLSGDEDAQLRQRTGALPERAHPIATMDSGRLGFAVAKRQLGRAVDRNALRRVAREAWRQAPWAVGHRPAAAMIKLRRAEPGWHQIGRPALKKLWREELDRLLGQLASQLERQPANRPAGKS